MAANATLPNTENLRPMVAQELCRLIQWRAPGAVLGRYPELPQLKSDAILAVSGSESSLLVEINEFLRDLVSSETPVQLLRKMPAVERIEVYLNLDGIPAWSEIAKNEYGFCWTDSEHVLSVLN